MNSIQKRQQDNLLHSVNEWLRQIRFKRKESGVAVINGKVKGDINWPGKVIIAHNGSFHGNIQAQSLVISGEVKGSIHVNTLWIHEEGKLYYYKANYADLVKDEGSIFVPADSHKGAFVDEARK